MQDFFIEQLWQEPFTSDIFSHGPISCGMDSSEDSSSSLSESNSNSSFDSVDQTPIDNMFIQDNLFCVFDRFAEDLDQFPDYDDTPVQSAPTFGSYQQSLEMNFSPSVSSPSEDEVQADSEDDEPAPIRRTVVKKCVSAPVTPKKGSLSTPLKKIQRSPEAKITKSSKTQRADTRKKRNVEVPKAEVSEDGNVQSCCCLSGCNNAVTNRLRFSLRRSYTFKDDYIATNWNKVCQYHYFSDLYQHKKSIKSD
ncbi:bioB [Acrasis kona]|uniref:BioB n=1 Tax=Acrasis kona TaxID=1008807 RepID=A0AAW2ZDS0_9EUKA